MTENKKGYSIIEGCIRQTMNLPINKATAEPRVYVDDDIYLYSPFISDHEYMDRMEKEKKSKEDEDKT